MEIKLSELVLNKILLIKTASGFGKNIFNLNLAY